MNKQKKILHIGSLTWKYSVKLPDNIIFYDVTPDCIHTLPITKIVSQQTDEKRTSVKEEPETYDVVILSDDFITGDLDYLDKTVGAYTVICSPNYKYDYHLDTFFKKKMVQTLDLNSPQNVIDTIVKYFFNGQYGNKFPIADIDVSPYFNGEITYQGTAYLTLSSDFGQHITPLCSWRYNVVLEKHAAIEIWLEYICQSSCDLQLHIQLVSLSGSNIIKEWLLTQKDLTQPIVVDEEINGYLSFSLWAKGKGTIQIGALHYRFSNLSYGQFLLGGQRYSDKNRQEFIYYFNPGNLTPPLNVYFSGYRASEGFEGYWMLKNLGHPFLLFADPRLEGGAFYMGSNEFEQKILSVIQDCLNYLTFTNKQMILSGLSMGTFGALYYGSQCSPHAIIIGKPLVNIGSIASLSQKIRPNDFYTSFDVLKLHTGGTSQQCSQQLNERFWTQFSSPKFKNTIIATSYMKHDDYDPNAYYDMIEKVKDPSIKIYGNGWIGRHNDNTSAIVDWFLAQYKTIIKRDFGDNITNEN